MFVLPAAVFFIASFVSIFPYGTSIETVSVNVNSSCPSYQTECGLGCCPFADGVCCADGFECCQHGQTCIPFVGICIGLKDDDGKTTLISSKSTPVKNLITSCPPGTTDCGDDKCCRFPHATCCSDGEHCCPQGYRCDISGRLCIKDSFNHLSTKWSLRSGLANMAPVKMVNKSPYKSCPGGRTCPSYMSCCINDNGDWSCCPNPSLPQLSFGAGDCCDTIFGHMCCPDDYPVCTPIGCTK